MLYNILKVSKNLMGGKYRKLTQRHKIIAMYGNNIIMKGCGLIIAHYNDYDIKFWNPKFQTVKGNTL